MLLKGAGIAGPFRFQKGLTQAPASILPTATNRRRRPAANQAVPPCKRAKRKPKGPPEGGPLFSNAVRSFPTYRTRVGEVGTCDIGRSSTRFIPHSSTA